MPGPRSAGRQRPRPRVASRDARRGRGRAAWHRVDKARGVEERRFEDGLDDPRVSGSGRANRTSRARWRGSPGTALRGWPRWVSTARFRASYSDIALRTTGRPPPALRFRAVPQPGERKRTSFSAGTTVRDRRLPDAVSVAQAKRTFSGSWYRTRLTPLPVGKYPTPQRRSGDCSRALVSGAAQTVRVSRLG
jgi:hypothetical protein